MITDKSRERRLKKVIAIYKAQDLKEHIKRGDVAVFPTDTVWGIGASIDYENSIKRIFEIKRRDKNKTLPILIGNKEYIYNNFRIDEIEKKIIDNYMPGPLTIVLSAKGNFSKLIKRNGTVAIRIPLCKDLARVLLETGPIAATSANISGESPLNTYDDIEKLKGVDIIVKYNMCNVSNTASTIVRVENGYIDIIREGAIKAEDIRRLINNVK